MVVIFTGSNEIDKILETEIKGSMVVMLLLSPKNWDFQILLLKMINLKVRQ